MIVHHLRNAKIGVFYAEVTFLLKVCNKFDNADLELTITLNLIEDRVPLLKFHLQPLGNS
jgi:hypothetical protein